jgi:glycosyltransferase involved in cell wall biosynthesis
MRLLALFPSRLRGGTEEYVLRIASAARREGWEVHGGWPQTPGLDSFLEDWRRGGMTFHPLDISADDDSPRTLTPWHHGVRCMRSLALLWKVRPTVVLLGLPWPLYGFGAILACALLRIPTMASFQLAPWPMAFWGKTLKAYLWAKTRRQLWVVNSKDSQKHLSESFHIQPNEICVIRNGIRTSQFNGALPAEERDRLRRQICAEQGLPSDARLLVTVARLHAQKGYSDLLTAAPALAREFPSVHFLWIGDGDLREALTRRIREAGLQARVHLLGHRTDLARYYQAADLFVFPTHFEGGVSFALVEAMASGAAIVSSDASGIPEVVENRVHGLLFPARNPEALAEVIRHALTHSEEMAQMARRGCDRASELTEERMCRNTLDALTELAKAR